MNIQHLKAFVLANQLGSISAAARVMGKRQSQVSQWISDLEIDMGVTLFERSGNKTSLSTDGEILLPMIIHTVSQAEKLSSCAETLSHNEPVSLRIGIDNYIPQTCVQAPLASILAEKTINLEVITDDRSALMELLVNEEIDIVLVSEHSTLHYNSYEYTRLGAYQEILVVGHQHPLSKLEIISTNDLSEYRELIWTRGEVAEDNDVGYSPSYACFSELSTLVGILCSGIGYAYLPKDVIQQKLENQELIHLITDFEQSQISRRVELIWKPGLVQTKSGKALIEALKKHHGFR
ncbi:Putative transcriptional regulator [Photobacterium marinum]|uniref:Putative transcriptional regulator n=1 Tax=Photobacterium marinum TaxID=1056511 RepID=L8J9J7_9GAMM|nr:LysR family transcriptional regulator [Photobacterium marinum]ELR64878.1 Putative transcriptional regulator [Photobacterium marinum]